MYEDKALQAQSWLLSRKKPETRPWTNLSSYLRENRTEMSQSDAEFISETYSSDCMALSSAEREPLSMFLERYLFWLFKNQVRNPTSAPCLIPPITPELSQY